MLLDRFVELIERSFQRVYRRPASRQRAAEHALAFLLTLGRRTISRVICSLGRKDRSDWSAEYKLYSRSPWKTEDAFDVVIEERLARACAGPIAVAMDDTRLPRTGKHVFGARWTYDPLSPPFHINLMWGLRMLHVAMLFPHYQESPGVPCRGVPVRFQLVPHVKKPGKQARDEERAQYRAAIKTENLSISAVAMATELRARLDQHGAHERPLIIAGDGSFCNRTVFRFAHRGVIWLSRARKNSRLCFPAPPDSRRIYDRPSFTPESIRNDDTIAWRPATVFYGGQYREIRFKERNGVYWQHGSGRRRLRVLVLAPQPYYHGPGGKTLYRSAAYLLCTDLELPAELLLQSYLDRWQIEVNHREMKDIFGVGDAQVRNPQSVKRHPAFAVAAYSALLIAGMQAFGPRWNADLFELPRWRRGRTPNRPSAYDLLARLRRELHESTHLAEDLEEIRDNLPRYAYG
jgi:hypothetical protein